LCTAPSASTSRSSAALNSSNALRPFLPALAGSWSVSTSIGPLRGRGAAQLQALGQRLLGMVEKGL
jgi:hypothetical protein